MISKTWDKNRVAKFSWNKMRWKCVKEKVASDAIQKTRVSFMITITLYRQLLSGRKELEQCSTFYRTIWFIRTIQISLVHPNLQGQNIQQSSHYFQKNSGTYLQNFSLTPKLAGTQYAIRTVKPSIFMTKTPRNVTKTLEHSSISLYKYSKLQQDIDDYIVIS